MKIIQINTWYQIWSTGKLVLSIHEFLKKQGHDSYVLYGRGKNVHENKTFKFCTTLEAKINSFFSRISGIPFGGNLFSTFNAIRIVKKINPDVIHLHCLNSSIINNYLFLKYLGDKNYKVIITLHAEYPYTGSCDHSLDCNQWQKGCIKCHDKFRSSHSIFFDRTKKNWILMNKAFNAIKPSNRIVVAVSDWLNQRARLSKTFLNDDIITINNGIDVSIFNKKANNEKYIFLKEKKKRNILFSVPNFHYSKNNLKGCDVFIDIVRRFSNDNNIRFIVVGKNKSEFDFGIFNNVVYLGEIHNQKDMAALYRVCDATLLLSLRETFSLVTAESLSCGTPVIGIKSGGPENIALKKCSFFFDRSNITGLIDFLASDNYINLDEALFDDTYYGYENMCNKYLKLYDLVGK